MSKVIETAPRKIWLCVDDELDGYNDSFPDDVEGICWSTDQPVNTCVGFIRADIAEAQIAGLRDALKRCLTFEDWDGWPDLIDELKPLIGNPGDGEKE